MRRLPSPRRGRRPLAPGGGPSDPRFRLQGRRSFRRPRAGQRIAAPPRRPSSPRLRRGRPRRPRPMTNTTGPAGATPAGPFVVDTSVALTCNLPSQAALTYMAPGSTPRTRPPADPRGPRPAQAGSRLRPGPSGSPSLRSLLVAEPSATRSRSSTPFAVRCWPRQPRSPSKSGPRSTTACSSPSPSCSAGRVLRRRPQVLRQDPGEPPHQDRGRWYMDPP